MPKPRALFCLDPAQIDTIYGPAQRDALADRLDLVCPPLSADALRADPAPLAEVEMMFSGWGGPRLDAELLAHAPAFKVFFYGAGSVRRLMTKAAWDHGLRVTTAAAMNAVPVAEFTVSQIVFGLKCGYQQIRYMRQKPDGSRMPDIPGGFGSTVGLVSLGVIARLVCERLKTYDHKVIAYDPFCSEADAAALGVTLVSLEELFATSDVVSIHTPLLPETEGLITGPMVASMKPNTTLINTSRGAVVDEPAVVEVLARRRDLVAVLDVTCPEPPPADSPLWDLDNVVLLPHIAGSLEGECNRMGQCMVDELDRYLAGEPLAWELTQAMAAKTA